MYQPKASDLFNIDEVECNFTRGVFRNIPGLGVVHKRLEDIDRVTVFILISGCDVCPPDYTDEFWASLSDLDDSEGVLECECGSYYLHPVVCSGDAREWKTELIK